MKLTSDPALSGGSAAGGSSVAIELAAVVSLIMLSSILGPLPSAPVSSCCTTAASEGAVSKLAVEDCRFDPSASLLASTLTWLDTGIDSPWIACEVASTG